jgi:hypothetical protein
LTVSEAADAGWRKSSHSGAGNDCVEIALVETGTAVRDSKNPHGPRLRFAPLGWGDFLASVGRG